MVRTRLLPLLVLSLSLAPSVAPAQTAPPPAANDAELSATLERFDAYLRDFRARNRVQSFSVAVVRDGEIVLARGYGFQDHDAEEPTTAETTYLAASITKTFTAATLLAMEADGHIDLQADFTRLSDWADRCEWLTRSGSIFGGGTLDDGSVVPPIRCAGPITLEQVLSHRVNGVPGSDFVYNPVVFGRLSNWVEEQTGRPWREWMHRYVIGPAGLEHTAAGWRDPGRGHVLTRLAPPFRHVDRAQDRDGIAPSVLPNPELNASSGIVAGVQDLARYAIALQQDRILSPALKRRMWTPPTKPSGEAEPYALGWWVQELDGRRLVWHGGWWPDAYAGLLLIAPDDDLALVALGNTDGIHWGNPLAEARVQDSDLAATFLELFAR